VASQLTVGLGADQILYGVVPLDALEDIRLIVLDGHHYASKNQIHVVRFVYYFGLGCETVKNIDCKQSGTV